jgi:hypothetical protein
MWSKPINDLTTDGTGFLFCHDLISFISVYIECSPKYIWYVYANVMMIYHNQIFVEM